jgi:hypothetical protein
MTPKRTFGETPDAQHFIEHESVVISARVGRGCARMLADGMIATRIRSTVELDGVSQMLEKLHNGGLRVKAVIRL